eukprot:m.53394 g.53394  ORF g.53394 m.53394 type:complete len:786 (-) comp11361_c0_seq7:104-2461(-)
MFGFISNATVDFLHTLENGDQLVKQLHKELKLVDVSFYKHYGDEFTLKVVDTAARLAGISFADVIAGMGKVQLDNFAARGYLPLVKSLGSNFVECLRHLDTLHRNLVNSYPGMVAPAFRPDLQSDGTLLLHYYSSRPGLWPYAIALLVSLAKEIYHIDVQFEPYQQKSDGKDHDIFIVHGGPEMFGKAKEDNMTVAKSWARFGCDKLAFNQLFPWHFQIDTEMNILSVGSLLESRYEDVDLTDTTFLNLVKLIQPALVTKTFDSIKQYAGEQFMVVVRDAWYFEKKRIQKEEKREARRAEHQKRREAKGGSVRSYSGGSSSSASSAAMQTFITEAVDFLHLRGEIVYLAESNTILFAGVPSFPSAKELYIRGLSMADLPMHSNSREMLLSTEHQSATITIASQLETTSKALAQAQAAIDVEKIRVQELLHNILPAQIAEALGRGEEAAVERFSSVSLLFSSIPSFDKIVGSVNPTQVMDFLNDLFSRFDALCTKWGVYKVETIGDSYMVASGIPEACSDHASRLCNFAVDMIKQSWEVSSPVDGSAVALQVGMHSGKILAGVVGVTRPRYCLFGDTVNVASRMTSTSLPGVIHYSAAMMSEIVAEKAPVKFRARGDISVKGKGLMQTFFLVGIERVIPKLQPPSSAFSETGRGNIWNGPSVGIDEDSQENEGEDESEGKPQVTASSRAKRKETFHTVVIKSKVQLIKVVGVSSKSQIQDVVETALGNGDTHHGVQPRVFADELCTKRLLLATDIGTVIDHGFAPSHIEADGGAAITLFAAYIVPQ